MEAPMPRSEYLGTQAYGRRTETMIRMPSPCLDIAPDVRTVCAIGDRYFPGSAYHSADAGRWRPAPRGSWQRAYNVLSWEDAAYAAVCFRHAEYPGQRRHPFSTVPRDGQTVLVGAGGVYEPMPMWWNARAGVWVHRDDPETTWTDTDPAYAPNFWEEMT